MHWLFFFAFIISHHQVTRRDWLQQITTIKILCYNDAAASFCKLLQVLSQHFIYFTAHHLALFSFNFTPIKVDRHVKTVLCYCTVFFKIQTKTFFLSVVFSLTHCLTAAPLKLRPCRAFIWYTNLFIWRTFVQGVLVC